MASDVADQARRALLTLADLSSTETAEDKAAGSIPLDWFRWLPASSTAIFGMPHGSPPTMALQPPSIWVDRRFGERLAAIDELRNATSSIRVGWLFVAGRTTSAGGKVRRLFQPLATRSVRVRLPLVVGPASLEAIGDVELSPLVTDPDVRDALEHRFEYGGGALSAVDSEAIPRELLVRLSKLRSWALDAAHAARLDAVDLIAADRAPDQLMRTPQLHIVAGCAAYAMTEVGGLGQGPTLRGWAEQPLDRRSAFHSLYTEIDEVIDRANGDPGHVVPSTIATSPVSPLPLTPAQRRAVVRSRTNPITVISGAPGTGKSHTIAAIALDALGRGESVLIAAKSDATIDALVDLLERSPGSRPIVFGSNERKDALAAQLAGGQITTVPDHVVEQASDHLAAAVAERDRLHGDIAADLRAESIVDGEAEALAAARVAWPVLFDPATDLAEIGRLIDVASHHRGGWFRSLRRDRATGELDALTGASTDAERRDVVRAYLLARTMHAATSLVASGGLDIGKRWDELAAADAAVRSAAAAWLAAAARSDDRWATKNRSEVAALATALRSGRAARRQQLTRLDARLTRALPLWVGTLGDIEDLLPRRAALFDVVVLDEASSIDQPLSAAALLRAARGVIVGDPRQLRHVSFLPDDQQAAALAMHGIDASSALAAKLDVRRNSAFDVAAGVAPVETLDEHFRGAPHLFDFVAKQLYRGAIHLTTRSPATESIDCVDVVRVTGARNKAGVVESEVDDVLSQLRSLRDRDVRSVGVVTPFRPQADAIEAAVLEAFSTDEIKRMRLRVGTVHAFQGNERDVVLASIGVGEDGSAGAWRFAQESHLFTVLVTRARARFVVVLAGDPPPKGLLARYLAQADEPPGRPQPARSLPDWPAGIAADLDRAGTIVLTAYPTGRHVVDLCVGLGPRFFGVDCTVHEDGADAHIERHLSLHRAGWDLREAFASRWADRRGELLVELSRPSSR